MRSIEDADGKRGARQARGGLGSTARKILEALIGHPEGLDIHHIRELCPEEAASEAQFDRRKRDIYKHHLVDGRREGNRYVYRYVRPLTDVNDDLKRTPL